LLHDLPDQRSGQIELLDEHFDLVGLIARDSVPIRLADLLLIVDILELSFQYNSLVNANVRRPATQAAA
jgi:hypothetical protein